MWNQNLSLKSTKRMAIKCVFIPTGYKLLEK